MNICFLNATDEMGGGELWVVRTCELLAQLGHHPSVICHHKSALQEACMSRGIELLAYSFERGSPVERPIYHFLKRRQIDVLYCTVIGTFCEAEMLSRIVRQVNRARRQRHLVLILKTGLPPMPLATPAFYGVCDATEVRRLHVVSKSCRKAFLDWDSAMHPEFVESHAEGIDLHRFDLSGIYRSAARQALGAHPNQTILTCLSRLLDVKGQDCLLVAAHELLCEGRDVFVVLAGEGDARSRLEALVAALGLEGRVCFTGHCEQVPELLAATDIVCHPSRQDGLPNALVEALAMKRPVIASGVGGIPELIHPNTHGLICPSELPADWARSIRELLMDPKRADAMALAGHTFVHDHYDHHRNLQRLLSRLGEEQAELDHCLSRPTTKTKLTESRPIRVLFVMNTLRTDGEETELALLARHLDPRRIRLTVLSCFPSDEPSPAADELAKGGIDVDTTCHVLNQLQDKVRHLMSVIQRDDIGIVVACQDPCLAYSAVASLPPGTCRLIEHGGIVEEATRVPKDHTARYIGVSPHITRAAAEKMDDPDRAITIPSMVDLDAYKSPDPSTLRQGYGLPKDACIATFVGRLDPKKGVNDLIDVAAQLLPSYRDLLFLVVGPPDSLQPDHAKCLLERAEPLIRTGRLRFVGGRGDVPWILRASDLVILPAHGEGMSHVINEGGAAGCAVVAYDSGYAREQLDDGRAGRLVPLGRRDRLAQSVRELVENGKERALLAQKLRKRVRERYAVRHQVLRWMKVFEEVHAELKQHTAPSFVVRDSQIMPFPAEIQIQTITNCNADCVMCPYSQVAKEFAQGTMDEQLYRRILSQCAGETGLSRIEPFLMNEPLLDKRMADWIALAKAAAPHAKVTLTTNGSPLTPKVADRLAQSGLDGIWFSVNGATPETYEQIMGLPYELTKRNIEYLLSVRPPSLHVYVNMVETTEMRAEIDETIRYWQNRGVPAGSSPLVNRAGNVENYVDLNYQPRSQEAIRPCDLLYHKMYVLYNGDVVLCCMDWRRQVVMGNLGHQSIREIWHGERYREYRLLHEEGRSLELELCSTCSYCHQ